MIVTSVLIPQFDEEESKTLIAGLGALQVEMRALQPPGLVETLLLREARGHGQLLTFWEKRKDLDAFLSSSLGARLARLFGELRGADRFEFRDYFVTWQSDSPLRDASGRKQGCC